ncbi:hypothetical protein [Myroides marinus]|uniref:hypothetical protein n=1 Tax=Myroides marinus TaxID=703342 RepID=UPI002578A887|nr:hypothetical protein [Myroides marinus]MDM1367232.1 hypothetical protein [Myroides marinus]MDM1374460.1 hypothetical protein [Myroides marinus]MDM1381615.1 hypothetical protein [Myroides marinus]
MKKKLLVLCSLLVFLGLQNVASAQVTIGTSEPPVAGALLQVKNIENVKGSAPNSTKGVMMPRVSLVSVNDLIPILPQGYDKNYENPIHAGLVVYNTNDNLPKSNGEGLYVWDGETWKAVTASNGLDIEVTPSRIFLSAFKTSDKATLTVKKSGQTWQMTSIGVDASSSMTSVQNGKISELTFTRSTSFSGDKMYTFKLTNKPEHQAQISVSNLDLMLGKEVIRVGAGDTNGAVNSSTAVKAIGGDGQWEIVDFSRDIFNWKKEPKNENGRLVFVLGDVKGGGTAQGEIKVRHANEPLLIKTIKIEQNQSYVALPPFDFLVVKYGPGGTLPIGKSLDVDSATEVMKTNMREVDNTPVGYLESAIKEARADGTTYMFYAGDNTTTASETSYVDIPKLNGILDKQANTSKQIEIGMSAWWFRNETSMKSATVTISVYKGGEMVHDDTNKTYTNKKEGVIQKPLVSFSSGSKVLNLRAGESDKVTKQTYKNPKKFTPMFKLEYDRVDNTGVLIPWNNWE